MNFKICKHKIKDIYRTFLQIRNEQNKAELSK